MAYCIYLRKSRSDAESEQQDESETLARHENILLDLARRQNLSITEIYREVVSGETISARPVVQKLLVDVEDNLYDGVLVIDIDRLARGDTIDQGLIARAFKYSNTKIITPSKTYDPNNEFDEEYFEFGLFMARREYKIITRRMQRGRILSAKEGKFIGSEAPYGYDKVKLENQKGFSLEINKEQSEIIKLIFNLFVYGESQPDGRLKRLGSTLIAKKLNLINIGNKKWLATTIRDILNNPVYIGKIRINSMPSIKKSVGGKIKVIRMRTKSKDWIVVDGLHKPVIDLDTWEKAQKLIRENNISPVKVGYSIKNPLAGLVYCGKCGRVMIRHIYRQTSEQIVCPYIECNNSASKLEILESKILASLEIWLENYKLNLDDIESKSKDTSETDYNQTALKNTDENLRELEKQLENIHDLLEKGIYDIDKFLERSKIITDKINEYKKNREDILKIISSENIKQNNQRLLIPKIERFSDIYNALHSPEDKNNLLKEVIEKVVYTRESGGRWSDPENFVIKLYPRISE